MRRCSPIVATLALAAAWTASGSSPVQAAKAGKLVGPYENQAYKAGNLTVQYFAVEFSGTFNRTSIKAAAEYGLRCVRERRQT